MVTDLLLGEISVKKTAITTARTMSQIIKLREIFGIFITLFDNKL
jgi:hypothetical protein